MQHKNIYIYSRVQCHNFGFSLGLTEMALNPRTGKLPNSHMCSRKGKYTSLKITGTSPSLVSLASFLSIMGFSKAFDKVSHSLMFHKLRQYGISGRVNRWIENFLSDRKHTIFVNGARSAFTPVESGVPQGSVLEPSLFLLYINDLPTGLSSSSRFLANDTIYHKDFTDPQDQQYLQQALECLTTWEQRWKMSFHPMKCFARNHP